MKPTREVDRMWCEALIAHLDTVQIQAVTATYLKLRDALHDPAPETVRLPGVVIEQVDSFTDADWQRWVEILRKHGKLPKDPAPVEVGLTCERCSVQWASENVLDAIRLGWWTPSGPTTRWLCPQCAKPAPVSERTMPCDNCGEARPVSERDHASGILICPECTRDPKRRKPAPVAAPAPLDEEGLVEKVAKAARVGWGHKSADDFSGEWRSAARAALAAMREADPTMDAAWKVQRIRAEEAEKSANDWKRAAETFEGRMQAAERERDAEREFVRESNRLLSAAEADIERLKDDVRRMNE